MKKLFIPLLIALLSISLHAEARGKRHDTPWYLTVKGGLMDHDAAGGDDAVNLGIGGGYRLGGYVSAEFDYTTTFIDGETPSGRDWEVDTLSAYAAMRSNTPVKLKGKMGITNIDTGGKDDWELSVGIGLGFWTSSGLLEVEFTQLGDDLDFFSVGMNIFY